MSLLAVLQRQVNRVGQTIVLRRIATGAAPIAATCKAVVRGYQPHELAQGIVQGDRRVDLPAAALVTAGWPVPPRKGDQVEVAGARYTVQAVDAVYLGETCAKYVLTVRG